MAKKKPQAEYLSQQPEYNFEALDAYLNTPAAAPAQEPKKSSRVLARMGDAGISLLKGAIAVPESVVGLADIATGGRVGKFLENEGGAVGFRPKQAREILDQYLTPEQQAANQAVQNADGFVDTAVAAVQNPSVIVQGAVESLPQIGAGGVFAQGLRRALPRMGAVAAGAAGEGTIAAGSSAEQIRQQTDDGLLTPQQSTIAAVSGGATGALGLLGGKIAQRFGLADVDALVAGAKSNPAAAKGVVRRVVEGAFAEGVLEELPQSVQEQVAQNYALGKPLDEGVDQAAVLGALSGGLVGGGINALPQRSAPAGGQGLPPPVAPPAAPPVAPPSGPLGRSVNAGAAAGAVPAAPPVATMPPAPIPPGVDPSTGEVLDDSMDMGAPVDLPTIEGPDGTQRAVFGSQAEGEAYVASVRKQARNTAIREQVVPMGDGRWTLAKPGEPGHTVQEVAKPATIAPEDAPDAGADVPSADMTGMRLNPNTGKPWTNKRAAMTAAKSAPGFEPMKLGNGWVLNPISADTGAELDAPEQDMPPADEPAATVAAPPVSGTEGMSESLGGATPEGAAFNTGAARVPTNLATAGAGTMGPAPLEVRPGNALGTTAANVVKPQAATVAETIDAAAHEAAPSPQNDRAEPTEAQKEAGNYKKGHDTINGLGISFENPAGSVRRGTDRNGKAWENTLQHHYGYLKGTVGNDKDHVDVFVKPETPRDYAGPVFVVDQVHPDSGKFDEHKVLLGFDTLEEAKAAYRANYAPGWRGMQAISTMPFDEFKAWVKDGPKNAPLVPVSTKAPRAKEGAQDAKPADDLAVPPAVAAGASDEPASDAGAGQPAVGQRPAGQEQPAVPDTGRPVASGGDAAVPGSAAAEPGEALTPAQAPAATWWDGADQPARLEALKAAGWGFGKAGPSTSAKQTAAKAWGKLTDSQRTRIEAAQAQKQGGPQPGPNRAGDQPQQGVTPQLTPKSEQAPQNSVSAPEVVEPKTLAELVEALDAGKRVHYDYAGTDGRTLWLEETPKGWVLKDRGDGESTVYTKGGANAGMGWGKETAIRTARDVAAFRFEKWKPTAAPAPAARSQDDDNLPPVEKDEAGRAERRTPLTGSARWEYPAVLPGAPKEDTAAQRLVVDYMNGDISRTQLLDSLAAANLPEGKIYSFTQRLVNDAPNRGEVEAMRNRKPADGARQGERQGERQGDGQPAKQSSRKPSKADASRQALESYFKPGNVVKSYDGHDEVLALDISDDGRVSVDVHAVKKIDGQWVRVGKPQDARRHSTMPEARELAAGPVAVLDPLPGAQVPYTEPRADGRPFPNARDRGASQAPADELDAEMSAYEDGRTAQTRADDRNKVAAAAPAPAPKPTPSANTVFTEDAAAKAREILRAKLKLGGSQLNSGIDPEVLQAGLTLAGYHIERGARTFAAYARAMLEDLGDGIKPYLKSWYMGVKYDPRAAGWTDMDPAAVVEAADVDALAAPAANVAPPAEPEQTPAKENNDAQANQPELGFDDPQAGGRPGSRRGPAAQQPAAQDDPGQLAGAQPGDVGPTGSGQPGQPAGASAAGPDVGAQEGTDDGRNAGDGRPRGGRKGNADAGAGGGRGSRPAGPTAAGRADPVEPESVSPANVGPGDFVIDDPLKVIGGGQVARFEKNKAAIELRNTLVESGRAPTREEQAVLAGYTGWGSFGQELFQGNWGKPAPKPGWEARDRWLRDNLGQKEWEGLQTSIINAHYTDPPTVLAMWDMVKRMGFTGGRVLEPSIGIGNFFGLMPADMTARSQRAGIELDPVTGGMAQMLYPQANIQIKGYEESTTPDNFYDLVIGNWPFFEHGPADRRYNRLSPTLHDYFFLKAIDQTRPGGLIVGITTKGTMDKKGVNARMEMARKAELVAAFRLPSGAFEEYAGTKVVTDIIILRKRDKPSQMVDKEGWIVVQDHDTRSGTKVPVNEYFHRNPKHVIGEIDFGHGTTTMRPGLIVHRPADMMEQLKRIVDLVPTDVFQARAGGKTINYVTNHTSDRTNALTSTPQGLFVVQGEYLAPADEVVKYTLKDPAKTKAREQQLLALIDMRRLYGRLIDAERTGDPEPKRAELRAAYEAFVKAHGSLSDSFGLSYLERIDDPFYPALAALEVAAPGEKLGYRPATIMRESTMRGAKAMAAPGITDAFVLARNEAVNPSVERIAELSGEPADKVRSTLIDAGAAFELPNGDFSPADLYLSGNVRQKMREAQAALESGNKAMERNVKALGEVMPPDVPYYKIETQMGATWVPGRTYADFIAHMLGLDSASAIKVEFQGGAWKIKFDSALNHRPEASSGFGSKNVYFKRLVRAAIANQTITVKRRDTDGSEYVDDEATKEVNSKISDMRMKFGEWLWRDPTRRVELEREYNEVRNAYATPRFDGSFLSFQGMALSLGRGPFNLREHQVNAIWRALVTRKSLNAHEVGTGKTFTMGGIAVESRRYGIAKKPLLFAHNANSKSVAHEIQMMYPGAKVLYVDNLGKENIKTRMMQIANDDWDVVVMPHSVIDRIGFKEETLMSMAKEEILDLEIAAEEAAEEDGVKISGNMWDDEKELAKLRSPTAKQLVKARLKIISTIKKLAMQASKEGAVSFEDMGVDMLLVDEAHEFKKPPIATKMRMKGLQTQTSDRSIAMMFLAKYVRSMNNGANVHLFTGTPITNTMTEVFHMMRYMMQEEMQDAALADWDGWFGSFAREVSDVELNPAGEYEAVTRLQSFINVPELRRMIGQYMDVVFSEDMPEMLPRAVNGKRMGEAGLTESDKAQLLNGRTENAQDRPYKKVINESSDMTPDQLRVFEKVQNYARRWRSMTKKERKEAMLSGAPESPIIHEGIAARASFDVRLVDAIANAGKEGRPEMEPHKDSKPARVLKNLLELYRSDDRVTQVVFMEQGMSTSVTRSEGPVGMKKPVSYPAFSTMKDMVERLVQAGVPRSQIATVTGSTTKDKRKEIADAMNAGTVRIVFGSSDSLGVGVNMQRNLRAMHHMDAPWMPGELEQRNGRGHRQGNQWNTVLEFRYLTDRLDGRRWQVLAIKQRFITDFMKSKGDARVIEGDAASDEGGDILSTFSEAAGDPRILLKEKFKKKLEQLQSRERIHGQAQADARQSVKDNAGYVAKYQKMLADLQAKGVKGQLAALIDAQRGEGFSVTIDGRQFNSRAEATDYLQEWAEANLRKNDEKKIGTYGAVTLSAVWPNYASSPDLSISVAGETVLSNGLSFASLESRLRDRRDTIEANVEESIERAQKKIAHSKVVADEPFHLGDQLKAVARQVADLEEDLARNPVAPPFWLRAGAPIDTEVFRNGKPFVVSGHRWADDGWFVLARDDKGETAIPYLQAMDGQGFQLYEEREFTAPAVQQGSTGVGVPTSAPAAPQDKTVVIEEGGSTNLRQTGAPEANTTDVVFSRATLRDPGLPAEQIAEHAADITARWINAPEVVVVKSMRDQAVPKAVRDEDARQQSQGASGQPEGFFYAGKVYLVAPELPTLADVRRVLFHEALGHYGLRGLYGKELRDILAQIVAARPVEVKAKAREYGLSWADKQDRLVAAEEVLAEMAQKNPQLGFVRRAIAAVRKFLRDLGLKLALSDDEIIAQFILPARAFVVRGQAGAGQEVPAFSRREAPDTDAFSAWFGNSKVVDAEGKPLVVYHGTPADFDAFDAKKLGANTGHSTAGLGFFFSADAGITGMFTEKLDMTVWPYKSGHMDGANTMPVYLSIKNPKVMTAAEFRLMAQAGGRAGNTSGAKMVAADVRALRDPSILQRAFGTTYDGVLIQGDATLADAMGAAEWAADTWVAFRPEQIKSAIGNRGTFDPANPDIRFSRAPVVDKVRDAIADQIAAMKEPTVKRMNWWHRTVGTQYQKARDNQAFARVFNAAQSYIDDTAYFANTAADLAPSLLPRLDTLADLKKRLQLDANDADMVSRAVFTGTLHDQQVYSADELRTRFGLTDKQIGLYGEFRRAVDTSLDQLVAGEVVRYLGDKMDDMPAGLPAMVSQGRYAEFRQLVQEGIQAQRDAYDEALQEVRRRNRRDMSRLADRQRKALEGPEGRAGSRLATMERFDKERADLKLRNGGEIKRAKDRFDLWETMRIEVKEKYDRIEQLQNEGYAPLMRFGKFTVDVVDSVGDEPERLFFGMYETEAEAIKAEKALTQQFGEFATVTRGIDSQEAWRMFGGVDPSTLEIFADAAGLGDNALAQQWIKLATSNRNAMKRKLHRQGIAGFSGDITRVLSAFITSNARATANGVHMGDMDRAIADIPKGAGDVKDEAVKLREYIRNPQEEAQKVRGLLFMSFLGGSVASAMVNMTQPFTMTLPWLSQFGGLAKAGRLLAGALGDSVGTPKDPALAKALKEAEARGIVSPQELHQLEAEASRTLGSTPAVRKALFAWGSLFSLAEQFNRRVTFIAAWRAAQGIKGMDAMRFAERAVEETQGIYSKANRPNWARGAIGATVFTFKQYSISYMEMLTRMWNAGAPGSQQREAGRKAVLIALAVLVLMAGVDGLPFADDIDDLVDSLGQNLGYATNAQRWRTEVLRDALGEDMAEVLQRGVSGFLPIDVSGRLSMSNLIPGTGLMRKDTQDKGREITEAVGPVGGLITNSLAAAAALLEGDPMKAARVGPVTAVKNAAQSADMLATDQYRDVRGRKVVDTTFADAVSKAIGFQPEKVAREQREIGMAQQDINLARSVESNIVQQWAEAVMEKDPAAVQAARDALAEWNSSNPGTPIKITAQQIRTRVAAMRRSKAERQMKAAPKELRPGLTPAG